MNNETRQRYLQAMGIETWTLRAATVVPAEESTDLTAPSWQTLHAAVATCTRCALHKTRTQAVFGIGNLQADLVLIGEAPGATEDQRGEPFVGRAGVLLNAMLQAIALNREKIFITNILKSRPPNNRAPQVEEVKACSPYLMAQLALLKPKLIVALGRVAAQFLLNTKESLAELRGRDFSYSTTHIPLLVTYHPAYLLRAPHDKNKAWEDLQRIAQRLQTLQQP